MLYNNPSFVEKLVQAKQEDVLREVRGSNEYDFLGAPKPVLTFGIKPKVLRLAGVMALLAWIVIVIH